MSIEPARWMKTPHGTEVDLGPRHIVLDGVPAPRKRGTEAPPPYFRPMSIVATVAHLSYCGALVSILKGAIFKYVAPKKTAICCRGVCRPQS